MKYEISNMIGKIIHADCLEVLKGLPDKCVDLILTDPPYGINIGSSNRLCKSRGFLEEKWDLQTLSSYQYYQIKRTSQNQIIWGGNYFASLTGNTRCFLIWDKNNDGRDFADCEMAFTSFDSVARIYRMRPMNMDGGKVHPTQKPAALFKWCLSKYSKEGDLVLDPFAGSGTTALACHTLNRRFICIEKEVKYVEVARKRLEELQAQQDLFIPAQIKSQENAQ